MKTSNYITLSFFTFLFGGIFILFLAAKIDPRSDQKQEFITDEKPLDNFSVVIAEPGANIRIKSGDAPKIGLYYLKDDTCTLPAYIVRNDTLFVQANPQKNGHWSTNVICRQINSIEGKAKSRINVEQLKCDSLLVRLDNAEFYYRREKNPVGFALRLLAFQSKVNLENAFITNLDVNFNKTDMDAWGSHIKNLSGKLNDKSNLSMGRIDRISLEADSTSTYRLEK